MGWENRNGRSYFYRKTRVSGRVVSVYVGTGAHARAVERSIAINARAKTATAPTNEYNEIDALIVENERRIKTMIADRLIAAGYHNYKNQWRKKRTPQQH